MVAAIAGPFPTLLMKLSKYRCRHAVRDAEAGWKGARPFLSSKPRFRNRGWSALSFAFTSGAVDVADGGCPSLEATNWRAEQAIRPMVVTRKVWGWKSNLTRSTDPRHSSQHSSNLPSATPLRFFYSSKADLCSSAQAGGLNCPYALNKYHFKSNVRKTYSFSYSIST